MRSLAVVALLLPLAGCLSSEGLTDWSCDPPRRPLDQELLPPAPLFEGTPLDIAERVASHFGTAPTGEVVWREHPYPERWTGTRQHMPLRDGGDVQVGWRDGRFTTLLVELDRAVFEPTGAPEPPPAGLADLEAWLDDVAGFPQPIDLLGVGEWRTEPFRLAGYKAWTTQAGAWYGDYRPSIDLVIDADAPRTSLVVTGGLDMTGFEPAMDEDHLAAWAEFLFACEDPPAGWKRGSGPTEVHFFIDDHRPRLAAYIPVRGCYQPEFVVEVDGRDGRLLDYGFIGGGCVE